MANEISLEHDPGLETVYATILDPDTGLMARLDTHVWEAPDAANWDAYDIPLTESNGSGIYRGDFPTWIPAGTYQIGFRERVGATVDETDDRLTSILFGWTGSAPASGAEGDARATLAGLITRLRRMIGDDAGAGQVFEDVELQDALDNHRLDVRNQVLETEPTLGATVEYLTFFSELGNWETDALIQDAHYATVTPATSDYLRGRWTFAAEPEYPLFVTGKSFDLFGAAADVLEEWAAKEKLSFTFSPGRGNYTRSQKHQMLLTQAAHYRAKQRPMSAAQVRSDVGDGGGGRSLYDRILRR